MRKISLKLPVLLFASLIISACSNTPSSLKLTPQLDENISIEEKKSNHNWLIKSKDLRTARYLIAISSGDEVATLINESTSTRLTVEKLLQNHWTKQGYVFTDNKNNKHQVEVQILKLLAEVEQGTVSHETDMNVIVKIKLLSNNRTFSKTFRNHFEEKAPFNADIESLTTQLNKQLSQLLDQIVQDPELSDKLSNL